MERGAAAAAATIIQAASRAGMACDAEQSGARLRASATIEVNQSPTGLAFSLNGARRQVPPRTAGLTFFLNSTTTLAFLRPAVILARDRASEG